MDYYSRSALESNDLLVNLIGAVTFSIIGYFYIMHKGKGMVESRFIPKVNK